MYDLMLFVPQVCVIAHAQRLLSSGQSPSACGIVPITHTGCVDIISKHLIISDLH